MIQRIQSLYLSAVVVINGVLPFWLQLWADANGKVTYATDNVVHFLLFFSTAALALLTIFMYKNRKDQFVLNRLNIILNFILLGLFVYRSLIVSGENAISEKGIGIFLPVISIVFLVLANKAVKKDEDLVKSVDRLR